MVVILAQILDDTCTIKLDLIQSFLSGVAALLPATPDKFKIAVLLQEIDNSVAWGYGSLVKELLQGVAEYVAIVVSWKMLKLIIGVFASQLLK